MEAEQRGRLADILQAGRLMVSYVQGVAPEDFLTDTEKQDAVIRRIEIIGEAARHLTEETRAAIPALPFRRMRGMRNIVAHDYANVAMPVVWEVATQHIPELIRVLEEFFATPSSDQP